MITYLFVTFDNHEEEFRDVKEKIFEERLLPDDRVLPVPRGDFILSELALTNLNLHADFRVPVEPHMRARQSGLIEDIILFDFYYI